ncbi:2-aminoadipate aminotransferase [Deinococcus piscis]|uniref:2-aminoadipate aminotransferase n=1 Tax=Deinococcus piscis TaxID=394230 RepID=A0ABQ3KB37_9DEIO|nr:PLP-dependent aminotransferase family protein [Deinococcus piscis]GHG11948.1 2-aminoadipate aminotransferase [Deinococcus piscis]
MHRPFDTAAQSQRFSQPSIGAAGPAFGAAFSAGIGAVNGSALRDMLRMAQVPGMVNFGGGLPAPDLFPMDRIAQASARALEQYGWRAVQYGTTEGFLPLREWLAAYTCPGMGGVTPEHIQIMTGGQQSLDLIAKIFIDPGDTVLLETPTYMGAVQSFTPYRPNFAAVPTDEHGIDMDALEALLRDLAMQGRTPKFIYTIPNFQNPTGRTLSLERRERLLDLTTQYGVFVVEDDPYGQLRFSGDDLPSLAELMLRRTGGNPDRSHVVYCSSFSKTLAPGLRDAWVMAARPITDKLVLAKQGADMHTPTLNQMIVTELLPLLPEQVDKLRHSYAARARHMLAALDRELPPGVSRTTPEGGMFLWLTLPEQVSTTAMLPRAVERRVAYMIGECFHALGGGHNTMRLCFSTAGPEDIDRGITALAQTIREELAGEVDTRS